MKKVTAQRPKSILLLATCIIGWQALVAIYVLSSDSNAPPLFLLLIVAWLVAASGLYYLQRWSAYLIVVILIVGLTFGVGEIFNNPMKFVGVMICPLCSLAIISFNWKHLK